MKSPVRVAQKDLASWLALGVRHIRSLTTMGVLTQTADGYDLKASIQAYLTFLRSKTGSVSNERTRLLKAQADMHELKVRERTGTLVVRKVLEAAFFNDLRAARDRFQNLPDRMAAILAAEPDQHTIHQTLTTEIHQILTELSHGH